LLYQIASNACVSALPQRGRRPLPSGLGGPGQDTAAAAEPRTGVAWLREVAAAYLHLMANTFITPGSRRRRRRDAGQVTANWRSHAEADLADADLTRRVRRRRPPGVAWQEWDWGENSRWDADLRRDFNLIFDSVATIVLSRPMHEGYLAHWQRAALTHRGDPDYQSALVGPSSQAPRTAAGGSTSPAPRRTGAGSWSTATADTEKERSPRHRQPRSGLILAKPATGLQSRPCGPSTAPENIHWPPGMPVLKLDGKALHVSRSGSSPRGPAHRRPCHRESASTRWRTSLRKVEPLRSGRS
jgi:hypothetical protein